jgi:hypothetical protein
MGETKKGGVSGGTTLFAGGSGTSPQDWTGRDCAAASASASAFVAAPAAVMTAAAALAVAAIAMARLVGDLEWRSATGELVGVETSAAQSKGDEAGKGKVEAFLRVEPCEVLVEYWSCASVLVRKMKLDECSLNLGYIFVVLPIVDQYLKTI